MAQPVADRQTPPLAAVSREYRPRAIYVAAVLQGVVAVWLLLEPGGLPLAVFATLAASLTLWLGRRRERRTLIAWRCRWW